MFDAVVPWRGVGLMCWVFDDVLGSATGTGDVCAVVVRMGCWIVGLRKRAVLGD